MKEFNIAIAEDNDEDYQRIKDCLTKYFEERKIAGKITRFPTGEDFLAANTSEFSLVFMDIMMGEKNGMETAKLWRKSNPYTGLIFLTNLTQYAIEGYSVQALDYILKPVNYYSLVMKLDRVVHMLGEMESTLIQVKVNGGTKIIDVNSVYSLEVMGHDVTFIFDKETLTVYGNLKEYEEMLKNKHFSRCSATSLVNLRRVEGIYGEEVHLSNGMKVSIGRSKKKAFLSDLAQYLGGNL